MELTNVYQNNAHINANIPLYHQNIQHYASRSSSPVSVRPGQTPIKVHTNIIQQQIATPIESRRSSLSSYNISNTESQQLANMELHRQLKKMNAAATRKNNVSPKSKLVRSNTGSRKLLTRKRRNNSRRRRVYY